VASVLSECTGKDRDKKRATEKIRRPVGVMESYLESYAPFRVFLESYFFIVHFCFKFNFSGLFILSFHVRQVPVPYV